MTPALQKIHAEHLARRQRMEDAARSVAAKQKIQWRPAPPPHEPTFVDVLQAVSQVMGISVETIKSRDRSKHACRARILYYHVCEVMKSKSLPQIAMSINRDHSTVFKTLERFKRSQDDYAMTIAEIMRIAREA